jgi:hypothetical protein
VAASTSESIRGHFELESRAFSLEDTRLNLTGESTKTTPASSKGVALQQAASELDIRLRSLRAFFNVRNHPVADADLSPFLTRSWADELSIARQTLLRCSQLALQLAHSGSTLTGLLDDGEASISSAPQVAHSQTDPLANITPVSLVLLSEMVYDSSAICESMSGLESVSFSAWCAVGRVLTRDLDYSEAAAGISRASERDSATRLQSPLLNLTRNEITPAPLASDMFLIFNDLARLLEWLRFIEGFLKQDYPLKQTLPVFTLIHEDARSLIDFIETRALRIDDLPDAAFGALDGTSYATAMELRKVFSHELVGLSALRQAPAIYDKVENAHGLLRDSFQQSTVRLAQLFNRTLDGAQLFAAFQTRLEQSLELRRDLWTLLQLVRRAVKEPDVHPILPLLERLASFRGNSLRHLMYKDWEACERFIEEVGAARNAVELEPILHRFSAYLEALFGQVSMRAVLANHPFDFPILDS